MRYLDLKIETLRQAPSNVRTEGFAFLIRAGYLTREGGPTLLGQQTLSRLQELAKVSPDLFIQLGLPVIRSEAREIFFAIPTGEIEFLQCSACHYAARHEIARFIWRLRSLWRDFRKTPFHQIGQRNGNIH